MASIGLVQLKKLDEENDYRNTIFSWYKKYLNKDIKIIEDSWYTYKSSKHLFQILTNNREKLINKLYKNNIYPGVHYVDNTTYKMYKYAYGTCPKAHKYSTQLLTLPIHLDLTEKDVKKISNIINLEYEKI
jgi:dTDP-4-amino-4,6-dideoxygalactose transaminase